MEIALLGSEGLGMSRPGSVLGLLVFTRFFFSIPFLSEVLSCSFLWNIVFCFLILFVLVSMSSMKQLPLPVLEWPWVEDEPCPLTLS